MDSAATANEDFSAAGTPPAGALPPGVGGDRGRLNTWALLCLFSTLALVAHQTDDQTKANKSGENVWITTCASLSLAVSFVACLAHVGQLGLSALFVGTVIEGAASFVLVGLWAGALPVIMDPGKGLAQMYVGKSTTDAESADYQSVVSNANLFFTSWGAGVCALAVLAEYVGGRLGGGRGLGHTSKWYLLMLASVIVVIESSRFKKQVCGIEGGTEDVTCARNTYGLVTGIIGLVISFLISLLSSLGKDSALLTTVASFLMASLYTVCAGLVTFENGPATYVGNHYFGAWAGFFVSFALFGTVLKEFLGVGADGGAAAAGTGAGGGSVEMDNI